MSDFNELKDKLLAKLGQAAEGAKDIAEKVADGAKDVADKAADKAKVGSRIAKLNIEIATERDNMKKTYLEIGKLYYDTHRDDPDGFFIQLCDEISLAESNISEKEAEIAQLKESMKAASGDDDSIEVEFEEIVDREEAAAECSCSGEPECAESECTESECCKPETSEPECCCESDEGEASPCCCETGCEDGESKDE